MAAGWATKKLGKFAFNQATNKISSEASSAYNNAPSVGDMFTSLLPVPDLNAAHARLIDSKMKLEMKKDPLDRKVNNFAKNFTQHQNDKPTNWSRFKNAISSTASSGYNAIKNGFTRFLNLFRRGKGLKNNKRNRKAKRLQGKGVRRQKKRRLIK
jgi:hypothetical protein